MYACVRLCRVALGARLCRRSPFCVGDAECVVRQLASASHSCTLCTQVTKRKAVGEVGSERLRRGNDTTVSAGTVLAWCTCCVCCTCELCIPVCDCVVLRSVRVSRVSLLTCRRSPFCVGDVECVATDSLPAQATPSPKGDATHSVRRHSSFTFGASQKWVPSRSSHHPAVWKKGQTVQAMKLDWCEILASSFRSGLLCGRLQLRLLREGKVKNSALRGRLP